MYGVKDNMGAVCRFRRILAGKSQKTLRREKHGIDVSHSSANTWTTMLLEKQRRWWKERVKEKRLASLDHVYQKELIDGLVLLTLVGRRG